MNDDELSQEIQRILDIVEKLPEEYRLKTYEILLKASVMKTNIGEVTRVKLDETIDVTEIKSEPLIVPIDVKAFFAQNSLSEEVIQKLFLVQGSEIRPIYKLKTTKKATAQIQVACLVALENALNGNKFEFSIKDVRSRVDELKALDKSNFIPIFTRKKDLFTSLDDDEHVPLSPAGKTELADTIEELVG